MVFLVMHSLLEQTELKFTITLLLLLAGLGPAVPLVVLLEALALNVNLE